MVAGSVCLLAVLIGCPGRCGTGLVRVLNEVPAAVEHAFGPPAVKCESQASPDLLEEDGLAYSVADVELLEMLIGELRSDQGEFYATFRPSSARVKCFNGGRASRVDGLLRADLPNGHTTPTLLPGARANHPCLLLVPPPDGEGPAFDWRATHARTLRPTALVSVLHG